MNKNIFKIGVPALVLIGIIVIIAFTQKPIAKLETELQIEPFDFNGYVDKYISDSIVGQTNGVALIRYNHIYDIITAEASIVAKSTAGSAELLSVSDAADCYKKSYTAYFSIFNNATNQLFSSRSWDESQLRDIRETARMLQTRQGRTSSGDSLSRFIAYVDGYYSAVKLISNSKYCSSATSYQYYCSQAKQYGGYPYKNNSKLNSIQSEVPQNAITGWRNSISKEVDEICGRSCYQYSSYNEFYNDYLSMYNKVEECGKMSATSWGGDLKARMNQKDSEMKRCDWN